MKQFFRNLSSKADTKPATTGETITRLGVGVFTAFAGYSHLFRKRKEFQALVPSWYPGDPDRAVVGSGIIELALGGALLALPKKRRPLGAATTAFYVAVFPGNVAQYRERRDAFGLDTDAKRLARLPFQIPMIWAALHAAGLRCHCPHYR